MEAAPPHRAPFCRLGPFGGGQPPLILLGCAWSSWRGCSSLPTGAPQDPPPPSSMPRALCGARGSPRRRQPPPRQAGPGALINYLIFPLCLIYSPARLWPYAAFVVSGSLLWQAALAAQTPPPAFDPPTPPTPSSPATPQAPWRAPPGLRGVRGGGGTAGRGHIAFFFFPFPY